MLHRFVTEANAEVRHYKPPASADEEQVRVDTWKYRSGWAAGVDFMAKMLGYENERSKDR